MEQQDQEKMGLTVVEAAGILGIGKSMAWRLIRDGEIATVRLGRRVIVPRKIVEELLKPTGTK